MKVVGLDGRSYDLDLTGHVPLGSEQVGSSFHALCRELLATLYPADRRLEEVLLPGTGSLRADFYLPRSRIMVEVHGQGHYHYIPLWHKTRLGFIQAKKRDEDKRFWCEMNQIRHIELPHYEDVAQWKSRLLGVSPS